MNQISREETIEALKIIRREVCSYGSPYGKLCDCKYGVTKEKFGKGSENGCGCPELYSAIEWLVADGEKLEQLDRALRVLAKRAVSEGDRQFAREAVEK